MEQIIFAGPRTRKSGLSPGLLSWYVHDDPFSSTGPRKFICPFALPPVGETPASKKRKKNNPPKEIYVKCHTYYYISWVRTTQHTIHKKSLTPNHRPTLVIHSLNMVK